MTKKKDEKKTQTAPDAAPETAPKPDAAPETVPDAAPDTTPDTAPDAAPDTTPDTARSQEAGERDIFADLPEPCVWCGPTVKNVARQYTTYQGGGIPDALKDFIREHPEARGLLTSTEKFAGVRKRLETPGTVEAILYKQVKSAI